MAEDDDDDVVLGISKAELEHIREQRRSAANQEQLMKFRGTPKVSMKIVMMISGGADMRFVVRESREGAGKPLSGMPGSWFFPRIMFYK